jgi:hypothetical protein
MPNWRCQNHLRQLGIGLAQYSDKFGGYFPYVPPEGNLAAAGVYGPTLRAVGLIVDDSTVLCPGAVDRESWTDFRIPTPAELLRARGDVLLVMQRMMGGNFAYTLGYVGRDFRLHAVRNRGRDYYVLMADAPEERTLGNRRSQNHGGRVQNVLFESGCVRLISSSGRSACNGDDPYLNRRGFVAAGVGPDDAVVAPSYSSPLPALSGADLAR